TEPQVYLCRWHSCDVAAKCLNPSLLMPDTAGGGSTMGSDVVTELLREAAMLGGLRHPNIVWVYGIVLPSGVREVKAKRERLDAVGDIDVVRMTAALAAGMPVVPGVVRPPALVTEYLGAGSLRAALTRGSDFLRSDMVRVKLALDAARGMEYLHLKRIVHFDLKTANLLVGFREKSPTCKVSDFGLSKQRQQTYVTGVSSLRGTLPWTAPEIIRTPKVRTARLKHTLAPALEAARDIRTSTEKNTGGEGQGGCVLLRGGPLGALDLQGTLRGYQLPCPAASDLGSQGTRKARYAGECRLGRS
ncbi:hypothetical protein Vafri_296, partial [Volvox africanus]